MKLSEEIQKMCSTCGKDEVDCPTRKGCHFPNYDNWEAPGAEKEDTGCSTCHHWAAVKIGLFCPDCGQKLNP